MTSCNFSAFSFHDDFHDKRTFITSIQDTDLCCLHGGGRALLGVLALVLAQSLGAPLGSAVKDVLPVLVHLELDDDNLAGVDAHIDGGTVGLLPLDPLDVDPELLPVALHNLANLLALVVTPHHLKVKTDRKAVYCTSNLILFYT